jgi:hypothetical protein
MRAMMDISKITQVPTGTETSTTHATFTTNISAFGVFLWY